MSDQLKRLKAYKEKFEVKRLNVVLNEELHTKLKLTAFEQGITMSQYVTDLLEKELLGMQQNEEQKQEETN